MEIENYGTLIKNLRIQNNLTQNQVAEALGVTPGYISNVENNRTAMSLRILTYYARLVGCSLDSLVGELEPEYSETALDRELYEAIVKFLMSNLEFLHYISLPIYITLFYNQVPNCLLRLIFHSLRKFLTYLVYLALLS